MGESVDYGKVVNGWIRPEIWVVVGIAIFICLLSFISYFLIKRADPLKKPKGFLFVVETIVSSTDNFVEGTMGKNLRGFAPYIGLLYIMLPLAFTIGLLGFPAPLAIYSVPLTFALISFLVIQAVCMRYNGFWGWIKAKFLSPFFLFLPINMIAIFAPLISLSFRMFGNATAGNVIMKIVYWATDNLSRLFGLSFNVFGPIFAGPLHIYFDIIGAVIQTMVFVILTALFIALEAPDLEGK